MSENGAGNSPPRPRPQPRTRPPVGASTFNDVVPQRGSVFRGILGGSKPPPPTVTSTTNN